MRAGIFERVMQLVNLTRVDVLEVRRFREWELE